MTARPSTWPASKSWGKSHGVKYLKAMQCNNIPYPLGQGLWEGVPLRDVLRRVGKIANVRRVYYWGFHNNDPCQSFKSSIRLQPRHGDAPVGAASPDKTTG